MLKPLGNKVVVREIAPDEKINDFLIIPEHYRYNGNLRYGEVLATGPGKQLRDDTYAMDVNAGDTVLFGKYGSNAVQVDGEELLVLDADNILAVK